MNASDISGLFSPISAAVGFDNGHFLAVVLAVFPVFLLLAVFLSRRKISLAWRSYKARRCLKRLGYRQLANLHCPDGIGGFYTIDRLLLNEDGISLLECLQYPGKIFCADNIENWTQMLGRKSYSFRNPFFELQYKIRAVEAIVPGVPVQGYLYFDHLSEFPKGHPERVIYPGNIPEQLKRGKRKKTAAPLEAAWRKLQALASRT